MAIEALLQRHLADEFVDPDLLRRLHHAVDFHGPWPQLERLRRLGHGLGRAELVEIVVAGVGLLVGDRPVERVFFIAADRIEIPGRVRQIADALGERKLGRERQCGRATRRQKTAAVQEEVFGRGKAFGDFPPAAANDVHDPPPDQGAVLDTPAIHHGQVTATAAPSDHAPTRREPIRARPRS
jgi:hypothetical protein